MAVIINDTSESFETWINKDYIDKELKSIISKASILIVPFEDLRESVGPVFPSDTESVLYFFQKNLPQDILIDICISDSDYQTFKFNNHYRKIGKFVVTSVVIPVFINILSEYINNNFIKFDESKPVIQVIDNSVHTTTTNNITLETKDFLEPAHVEFFVTIVSKDGTSKKIEYKGPTSEIKTVYNALKEYEE